MITPSLPEFKQFCREHYNLARAVCEAMAFAQCERERVNAYILPLFQEWDFRDETGAPITNPEQLYLCDDDGYCTAYYKACDEAHRKHGFTGPDGHCPALVAEHLLIIAQNALLQAGANLLGFDHQMLWGDDRKKMLDLLLGACINIKKAA